MSNAIFMRNKISKKLIPLLKRTDFLVSFLLCVGLFCVLLVYLNQEIFDLDIWLHMKTGEQILLNKHIFLNDIYSFTKTGAPWINHEWLFQIISFLAYSFFGFDGIIGLQAIIFIAVFLMLCALAYRNKNFLFITLSLFVLLLNVSYRFTFRPDMFSILFLVSYLFIFLKKPRYVHLIPLLQVIWSNCHGFFILGNVIILSFALFERKRKIWIIFVISLLANLANPQLLKGAIYPLATLFNITKDRFVFTFIAELKRPFYSFKDFLSLDNWLYFKALIIITAFTFRFNQKKINYSLLTLWLISLAFALIAIRNIVYFAFISMIAIFYNVNQRIQYNNPFSKHPLLKGKYYYTLRYLFIIILVFCMHGNVNQLINSFYYDFENYTFKSRFWGISLRAYPSKAADFLMQENFPQKMFNNFNSGSYLVGQVFPQRKVFIDGRTEFYGSEFVKKYKEAADGNKEVLNKLVNQYRLDGFFLSMTLSHFDHALAKILLDDPEWILVYFNEDAIIFLKNTKENKRIIDKYALDLSKWTVPKVDIHKIGTHILDPYQYLKRGKVLLEMNHYRAAIGEAMGALKLKPDSALAYELLGISYFKLKQFEKAATNLRIAVSSMKKNNDLRAKYAISIYHLKRYEESEKQWLNLKKKTPKDPFVYYWLSLCYKNQSKFQKAQEAIQTANKYSNNENLKYIVAWAKILRDSKKINEAKNIYESALKLSPGNSEIEAELSDLFQK